MGGRFALLAPPFATDQAGGGMVSIDVEPTRERRMLPQRGRLAGQGNEDLLGHVVGRVGVSPNAAQSRGVDQPDIALNQCSEGRLGTIFHKPAEELGIGIHEDGYTSRLPPIRPTGQNKCSPHLPESACEFADHPPQRRRLSQCIQTGAQMTELLGIANDVDRPNPFAVELERQCVVNLPA